MDERRFTVLSVSDDELLLATRERVITTLGLEVVSCVSRDALERLRSERFDLAVLGHSLKHATARDLAEEARRNSPGVRILLLSRTPYHLNGSEFADAVSVPDPAVLLVEIKKLLGIAGNIPPRSHLGRESL